LLPQLWHLLRYIESTSRKSVLLKPVLSCHKHNLKPNLVQYIYPISYKIAKKGKPYKMDLPLCKNDITGSEPVFGIANILQITQHVKRKGGPNWPPAWGVLIKLTRIGFPQVLISSERAWKTLMFNEEKIMTFFLAKTVGETKRKGGPFRPPHLEELWR